MIAHTVVVGLAVFLVLTIAQVIGPRHWPWEVLIERNRISHELPGAIARWNKLHIEDYDIDVVIRGLVLCGSDLTLQVRHGVLMGIIEHERDWLEDRRTGKTTQVSQIDRSLYIGRCHVETLLPPLLLEEIKGYQETSEPLATFVLARFNAEFGFVEELRVESNQQGISHCCSQYTFSNFQLIPTDN